MKKELQITDILLRFAEMYRKELYDNIPNSDIEGVAMMYAKDIVNLK